jgi:hypothetical protein
MCPFFCYVLHQTSITLGMIFFFERILVHMCQIFKFRVLPLCQYCDHELHVGMPALLKLECTTINYYHSI